jgi:hypothetical protein
MNLKNWWKRLPMRNPGIQRQGGLRLRLEELETRCVMSVTGFRPIDEMGNNEATPTLGTANQDLLRVSPAAYANGFFTPGMGGGAPTFVAGSRLVSNTVSNQATTLFGDTDVNTVNSNGLSDFGYAFGQFMDHDMDLTPTLSGKITAASWSAGTATITVADGLFLAGNAVTISGTPGFNGVGFIILTATPLGGGPTTFTFALAADPGPTTTLGVVANTTTRDGANGFPIPADAVHTPTSPLPDPIGSLAMSRSVYNLATGTVTGPPREQTNVNTAFLDLSQVYGSTTTVAEALRVRNSDGSLGYLLKSSPGANLTDPADDLLPFNRAPYFSTEEIAALGMANDSHIVSNDDLFAAGDVRANETTELSSLHTLFMRNHNRLAAALATQNPADFGLTEWTDDTLYQEARKLNIAQYQNIVYNGYLPALLGPTAIAAYSAYSPTVDPSIANEFSTVAFRFGHSLLNNTVPRVNNDGSDAGELTLLQSFFNPHFLTPGFTGYTDIGAVLKGDADNSAQEMDVMAVRNVRNLLFGNSGVGEDLIARDMWRAHDNGIGTYNQVRIAYGLDEITDSTPGLTFEQYVEGQPFHGFEQISSDPAVVTKLVTAYAGPTRATFLANGKFAGSIDPFAAGIAEDHVPGSNLGLLFHTILVDQFERLRDGDRFFYLNQDFTPAELSIIDVGNTLAKVIKANTSITNLQDDVFKFLTTENGQSSSYYTDKDGQAELTGSRTGSQLSESLYNDLIAALAHPTQAGKLVLVNAAGNYMSATFFRSYGNLKDYLKNVNDNNMAYALSAQLLVTELNVLLHKVDPTASIFVPVVTVPGTNDHLSSTLQGSLRTNGVTNASGFANIQDILDRSIATLLANPDTKNDGAARTFQEALKACLDGINDNQDIFSVL